MIQQVERISQLCDDIKNTGEEIEDCAQEITG